MPPLTADPPAETPPLPDAPPRTPAPAPPARADRAAAATPPRRVVALLLGVPLLLWLSLVVLSGTSGIFLPDPADEDDAPVAPAVIVAPVEVGPLVRTRGFSGTLVSPAVLEASALVGGRVTSVGVRLGDVVQPGQPLVQLDPEELEQAALAAEARLAVAKANASEATAAETIAERTVARVRQLREEGLTSEAEADTAEARRLAAAAAVEVAEAQRLSAEAEAAAARIRRSYATVRARFGGAGATRRVAAVTVQEGDSVSPGDPLVRLVQLDPLRAVFSATQADHAGLSTGQPVELTTDAYPGRRFAAAVDRLAPSFSESSRQARVEVDVANPDGLLRPGMFVRLTTDLEALDDAVSVPRDAVTRRDDENIVFVLPPGVAAVERVAVELGMTAGDRVQVLSPPLPGGSEVVVLGQQLLEDGQVVNPARSRGEAVAPLVLPEEAGPAGRNA
ncbi:efflux RND transporter periplasmic adaptor subunit [Phycisphaera mikurensis]|uniref:efflux RND transporter periplasmic adaptor subunit n=1 Tax=Phycisphaera mikurensis TaxID=547188 RepID=UPI00069FFE42|nr:efflux RND transporter periplasmic adaptor subunit [Phycisphaera mikurensis]MBB6441448.1 RND family efflux transporter MFP subunit [Phycisphaera mikurensis]